MEEGKVGPGSPPVCLVKCLFTPRHAHGEGIISLVVHTEYTGLIQLFWVPYSSLSTRIGALDTFLPSATILAVYVS